MYTTSTFYVKYNLTEFNKDRVQSYDFIQTPASR